MSTEKISHKKKNWSTSKHPFFDKNDDFFDQQKNENTGNKKAENTISRPNNIIKKRSKITSPSSYKSTQQAIKDHIQNEIAEEEREQYQNLVFSRYALTMLQQDMDSSQENPYGVDSKEVIQKLLDDKLEGKNGAPVHTIQKTSSKKDPRRKQQTKNKNKKKKKKGMSLASKLGWSIGVGITGLGFLF